MNGTKTLSEFILHTDKLSGEEKMDLLKMFLAIEKGAKIINKEVNRAGLGSDILGAVGTENVQGEEQQKLDVYSNDQMIAAFTAFDEICGVASEEDDSYLGSESGFNKNGKYVVAMDPLDGSSNIDVNVSIGTIFSIFKRQSPVGTEVSEADFLQPGKNQFAGGYVLYGSSTQLVFTFGNGVHIFILDPNTGDFMLTNPDQKSPETGRLYSINEGNYNSFSPGLKAFIDHCKSSEGKKPFSARYIGSLVADFHRNLLKGGIYVYPGTASAPNGKLRLLYEANPLAFIIEQAGGKASTGKERIMDINPTELHQRVPLYIGSSQLMDLAHELENK